MNNNITVFDFDKTLTVKDTLFGFFLYVSKGMLLRWPFVFVYMMLMVLTKINIIDNRKLKVIGVRLFLQGKKTSQIEILGQEYSKLIDYNYLIKQAQNTQGKVILITASFDVYTKHVLPGATVIASTLISVNGRISGLDFNCYGENKVNALNRVGVSSIDIFYTDSAADLPLVKISNKTILVTKTGTVEFNTVQDFINKVCNGNSDF